MSIIVNIPKKTVKPKIQINIKKTSENSKRKTKKKAVKTKKCLYCQKEFISNYKQQKYCSRACGGKHSLTKPENIQKQIQKQTIDFEKVAMDLKPFLQHGASISYACNATGNQISTVTKWLKLDTENLPENYELIKKDLVEFQRQIALAKEFVNFAATKVIQKKIFEEGDDYNARWWLEKRNPDFIPKQKQNIDTTNKTLVVWGLPKSPYVDQKKLPEN